MQLKLSDKKIFVALGSEIDEFRFNNLSTNLRIEELNKPNGLVYFEVQNIKAASKLCRDFIKEYGLGSGNWIGGRIINENFECIANISYNGRIWL